MPQRRNEWLKMCTAAIGFLVIVALARFVGNFAGTIDDQQHQLDRQEQAIADLRAFITASRESRIEFQARGTFLLCSRDPSTVTAERQADVAEVCDGYSTIDEAIATEHAKQNAATG